MLIKYQTRIINLDNVIVFRCSIDNSIRFYYSFIVDEDTDWAYSKFEFDSEEIRDLAFNCILTSYQNDLRICDLDAQA